MTDKERQRIQDKQLKAWEKAHDEAERHNEVIRRQQESAARDKERRDREDIRDQNTSHGAHDF